MGWSEVATLLIGVVWAYHAINQSERHLTFLLNAGALVPWRIAIIMANLPGARQPQLTAEESDVVVRAVKSIQIKSNFISIAHFIQINVTQCALHIN